jgi:hypothetical protein
MNTVSTFVIEHPFLTTFIILSFFGMIRAIFSETVIVEEEDDDC